MRKNNRLLVIAIVVSGCILARQGFGADHFIGVNFAGGNAAGAPTLLATDEKAGVMPQVGWNNFSAYSLTNWTLLDDAHAFTGVSITYTTQEMWGSGAFDPASNTTNGNAKLLNGYLNSQGDRTVGTTNTITFNGLDLTGSYSVIAYTLRDSSAEQAAYWVNDAYDLAFHILSEGGSDWILSPQFRQATNTDASGGADLGNYVQWANVSPRANGSLSVNVASEFYRGPINGIQLISTAAWPANTNVVAIVLPPRNVSVSPNQPGTFRVVINGPWNFQWYSNDVTIAGATNDSFITVPLVDELGTRAQYKVKVSNGISGLTSDAVHLILVPPLPPGGIFYDGFAYPSGPLGNWGEWTLGNIAQVTSPGLTYNDGTNSLEVSGNAMVAPIDWDPFANIPLKVFGTNLYGGANTTNFMSYLFDFRNLNATNNSGYVGVSAFEGNPPSGFENERFFVGKTWYGDFLTVDGRNMASTLPYWTNGFLVVRITQDDSTATYDLFFNPPLAGLPAIPDATGGGNPLVTFNAVGVNAGEWAGPKGDHTVPFTELGPIVDEFRFGSTYASVARIQAPTAPALSIQLAGQDVTVSWTPPTAGFILQMTDNLSAPSWTPAPTGNPVTISMAGAAGFFRLFKQ